MTKTWRDTNIVRKPRAKRVPPMSVRHEQTRKRMNEILDNAVENNGHKRIVDSILRAARS